MRNSKAISVALWTLQGFLALFFGIASGAAKFLLPADLLTASMPIPIPMAFVQFIGVCEILGAVGLILPGITHIRTGLTPLAATGLVLLTICAAIYQVAARQPESAVFALVLGLLAAIVAYGRWRIAPIRNAHRSAVLTPAS